MFLALPSTPFLFSAAVVILLFAGNLTLSLSQDVSYPGCSRTFSCGTVRNITYPFTGGDRPDYCGLPQFRLTCRDNYPELTSNSFTYRVLQVEQNRENLILARLDLWNNTCPREFFNSTLNSTFFSSGDDNEDLTLFFGCNSTILTIQPQNRFVCNVSGVNFSDSFYLIGPIPKDPILNIVQCYNGVRLPVLRIASVDLISNRTTLAEALTQGFSVNYTDPYNRECLECTGWGGQCGFDLISGQPICICGERQCFPLGIRPFTCEKLNWQSAGYLLP